MFEKFNSNMISVIYPRNIQVRRYIILYKEIEIKMYNFKLKQKQHFIKIVFVYK